ncbi:MAG: c-type cytochrome [Bacteroidota bacterium]
MKKTILTTVVIAGVLAACKTTKPTETKTVTPAPVDCGTMSVSYTADIKPIFEQYCNGCHGKAGGYNFAEMADIKRSAQNGTLLGTIKWEFGFSKMPAGGAQLDAATIAKVECWIKNGMRE